MIFHDLLLYTDYQKGISPELIKANRQQISLDVIRVISLAAQADGQLSEEEEAIFELFMASADLDRTGRELAKQFWENSTDISDLSLSENRSWMMNRYLIEIAVLTVWSDRVVTSSELLFLDKMTQRLGIPKEECDKSFIAIQAFVMNNYEIVPFLKGKNEAEMFMAGAAERWRNILGRNKEQLAAELKESKELVGLIRKSTTEELTKEEKERAKNQLKDLARTIPSLTLFMLPGGSLLLPIVLKIIPDLVPTSFRSNRIDEQDEKRDD